MSSEVSSLDDVMIMPDEPIQRVITLAIDTALMGGSMEMCPYAGEKRILFEQVWRWRSGQEAAREIGQHKRETSQIAKYAALNYQAGRDATGKPKTRFKPRQSARPGSRF